LVALRNFRFVEKGHSQIATQSRKRTRGETNEMNQTLELQQGKRGLPLGRDRRRRGKEKARAGGKIARFDEIR